MPLRLRVGMTGRMSASFSKTGVPASMFDLACRQQAVNTRADDGDVWLRAFYRLVQVRAQPADQADQWQFARHTRNPQHGNRGSLVPWSSPKQIRVACCQARSSLCTLRKPSYSAACSRQVKRFGSQPRLWISKLCGIGVSCHCLPLRMQHSNISLYEDECMSP